MVDGPDLAARIATAIEHAPVRLAIDGVGGEPARQLIDLLAPGGTLVRYSGSDFDPDAAARKGITSDYLFVGYAARTWRHKRSAARGDLAESDLALRQRSRRGDG